MKRTCRKPPPVSGTVLIDWNYYREWRLVRRRGGYVLQSRTMASGYLLEEVEVPWLHPDMVIYRRDKERMREMVRSRGDRSSSGSNRPAPVDQAFKRSFPEVWEYCSAAKDEAGEERQPSSLLFFIREGQWRVCLTDRHTESQLWAAGTSFQDALLELEEAIKSGSAVWRETREDGRAGKRRDRS